jgi:hypothetical protein
MLRGQQGGFYPSIMSGLTTAGPYFLTAAFAQGARLLHNNKKRMTTRRRFKAPKKATGQKVRKTLKKTRPVA